MINGFYGEIVVPVRGTYVSGYQCRTPGTGRVDEAYLDERIRIEQRHDPECRLACVAEQQGKPVDTKTLCDPITELNL